MIDHYLIARAQAKATGETAHLVGNTLHVYLAYAEITETHNDIPHMVAQRDEYERRLRAFCVTGRADSLVAP